MDNTENSAHSFTEGSDWVVEGKDVLQFVNQLDTIIKSESKLSQPEVESQNDIWLSYDLTVRDLGQSLAREQFTITRRPKWK